MNKFLKKILVFFLIANSFAGIETRYTNGQLPSLNKCAKTLVVSTLIAGNSLANQENPYNNSINIKEINGRQLQSIDPITIVNNLAEWEFSRAPRSQIILESNNQAVRYQLPVLDDKINRLETSYAPLFSNLCAYSRTSTSDFRSPSIFGDFACNQRSVADISCSTNTIFTDINNFKNAFLNSNGQLINTNCNNPRFINPTNPDNIEIMSIIANDNFKVSYINQENQETYSYDTSVRSLRNTTNIDHQVNINTNTISPINIKINQDDKLLRSVLLEKNVFMTQLSSCNKNPISIQSKDNELKICSKNDGNPEINLSSSFKNVVLFSNTENNKNIISATGIFNNQLKFMLDFNNLLFFLPQKDHVLFFGINESEESTLLKMCLEEDKTEFIDNGNKHKNKEIYEYFKTMSENNDCFETELEFNIVSMFTELLQKKKINEKFINFLITEEDSKLYLNDLYSGHFKLVLNDLLKDVNNNALYQIKDDNQKRL